jgi:hypothetical protein
VEVLLVEISAVAAVATTAVAAVATTAVVAIALLVLVAGKIAAMAVVLLQLAGVPMTMAGPVVAVVEQTTTVDMAEPRADPPIGAV